MNVALRDIRPEDKSLIRTWRNLPEVARYMYTDHLITAEEHERWFQGILNDHKSRYWIITHNQEDVGLANLYGIDEINRRAYWAFYLADPSGRGKGVGGAVEYLILRYVFDELQFNRLCCEVLATNPGVIEMHKNFGFIQKAYFRQHVIKNGQPMDVVLLAFLREDWALQKPGIEKHLRKKRVI
ncbi:MAG: UDP-4-amino-4,6-dideoxy-N-acetyl-beta-L-altrosamine N-acetyltransferase [Deltaproteobacteria bacterium]